MTRFNRTRPTGPVTRTATGPLTTVPRPNPVPPPARTFNNAPGWLRDPKSELFLLATTSVDLGENAFYEMADPRVRRFNTLVIHNAITDPDWTYDFLTWLRGPGNIRTAAIVGAVQASLAMIHDGIHGSRSIIRTVLQRADEPGEMIAYLRTVVNRIPMPIKRGIADAVVRLYTERSMLKYDTDSHQFRFGDVIELVHPIPGSRRQSDLFRNAIDRRHGRGHVPEGLPMVSTNLTLRSAAIDNPALLLDPDRLRDAGMTWEAALSLVGSRVSKQTLWASLIPSMGFMARIRNLRNFDANGLTDSQVTEVIAMLQDPEQVANSRQLPLRFLSAYRAAPSLRWSYPLERALDLSLANIPALPGRTLIMIDTSYSMNNRFGKSTELKRWDAAVSFGLALARRCENADVVSFSDSTKVFNLRLGASLLSEITRWKDEGYFLNSGTATGEALQRHFDGHDRVIVLTDEQADPTYAGGRYYSDPFVTLPESVLTITANLAGYAVAHAEEGPNRVTIGGLVDSMFLMIPTIENGLQGRWPWEVA